MLGLAAVGVAAVTACSSGSGSTSGQPTAPSETPKPSTPTTSSKAPVSDFTNAQLCELLTADEATQLGGSPQGKPSYGLSTGHPICQWSKDTTLNIDFGKDSRSSQVPTGEGITNTPTEIEGLTAMLSHKVGVREFCQVIVDVTSTSTMAFGSGLHDSGKGKFEPCDVARRLATIVIPKVNG